MKRTIEFGKIDYNNVGRKVNLVTVEMSLKNSTDGFPAFSASVFIWNARHTDILAGGQMLDQIVRVPENNELFQEIKKLWKAYHLNDMHAGTRAQESALTKAKLMNKKHWNYQEQVDYLKRKGLYEVELTPIEKKYNPRYASKPYKYGSGWLYRPIPTKDLSKIKRIIGR